MAYKVQYLVYPRSSSWAAVERRTHPTIESAQERVNSSKASSGLRYRILDENEKVVWEGMKGDSVKNNSVTWRVQFKTTNPRDPSWCNSEAVRGTFSSVEEAKEMIRNRGKTDHYRIHGSNGVTSWEGTKVQLLTNEHVEITTKTYIEENTAMDPINELQKPLSIPREALITALQAKLDEEQAKAKKIEEEKQADEKKFNDAVGAFTDEEIRQIIRFHYSSSAEELVKAGKSGCWAIKPVEPTKTETELAKAVRVLGIASDETVEILPSSNLYNLL